MKSLIKLQQELLIEAVNPMTHIVIGYHLTKKGIKSRKKLNIHKTENGKIRLSKPQLIRKTEYEKILDRNGIGESMSFTEIQKKLTSGEINFGMQIKRDI